MPCWVKVISMAILVGLWLVLSLLLWAVWARKVARVEPENPLQSQIRIRTMMCSSSGLDADLSLFSLISHLTK